MTNGDDQWIKCVDCGEDFPFTAGEQAFYASKGLTNAPTRCKRCREVRKQQRSESGGGSGGGRPRRGAPREMHTTVCSACGAETQVPFVPVSSRPVYCKDCYEAHRPAHAGGPPPGAGGQGRGPREPRPERSSGPRPVAGEMAGHGQGEVKWFNESKGFGFIRDDSGEELFVHFSAIAGDGFRTLAEGQRVEYDIVVGPKGRQATNVVRAG